MKIRMLLSAFIMTMTLVGAAEIQETKDPRQQRINDFALPQDTTQWADSIMALVGQTFPEEADKSVVDKFQELVNWSCGEHANLKATNPERRAETIKYSLMHLIELAAPADRVTYLTTQLDRHKGYVPKNP